MLALCLQWMRSHESSLRGSASTGLRYGRSAGDGCWTADAALSGMAQIACSRSTGGGIIRKIAGGGRGFIDVGPAVRARLSARTVSR